MHTELCLDVSLDASVDFIARKALKQRCHQGLIAHYGVHVPEPVAARLEKEIAITEKYNRELYYLLPIYLTEMCKEKDIPLLSGWYAGGSLILYLCGAVSVNPLTPHYRCPQCKQAEFVDFKACRSGFDLPNTACPYCKARRFGDGHHVPFAFFSGYDGSKVPSYSFLTEIEHERAVLSFLEQKFKNTVSYSKRKYPMQNSEIRTQLYDMLLQLKCRKTETGEPFMGHSIYVPRVLRKEDLTGLPRGDMLYDALNIKKPLVFSDVVQAVGRINSMYETTNNAIVFREDIMTELMCFGIEPYSAYRIAETVRKGRADRLSVEDTERMKENGVSEEYLRALKNVRYLCPKTHAIEWASCFLQILWYNKRKGVST